MDDEHGTASDVTHFGFRTCLSIAWVIVRDHWFQLIVAKFFNCALPIIAAGLVFLALVDSPGLSVTIALSVGLVTFGALQAGYVKLCLNLCANGKVRWRDLFCEWMLALPMLVASLCYLLLTSIGWSLLIIPGCILMVRLAFYGIVLVDQRLLPLCSLQVSNRLVKGYAWYTFGFLFIGWAADESLSLPRLLMPKGLVESPMNSYLTIGGALEPLLIICLCVLYRHIMRVEESK
jgi:hypothetical protein